MASTIASLPALVLKILKLAFIARVESFSMLKVLPILLVASCSKFRNTSLGSIEFSAKITFPVEALANSEKATIRPLIVRLESSAAVIAIGIVNFIGSFPLLSLSLPELTLRLGLTLRKLELFP